jgi:hypothetical protein
LPSRFRRFAGRVAPPCCRDEVSVKYTHEVMDKKVRDCGAVDLPYDKYALTLDPPPWARVRIDRADATFPPLWRVAVP